MKIALITNTSDKIAELSKITLANQLGYASKNGYELMCDSLDYANYNNIALQNMGHILEEMNRNDVVMTIGADVMFMNWGIKVEDVLRDGDGVVMAWEKTTWWPINNDVMIWRCVPGVIRFYERLMDEFVVWKNYPWRLQAHLWNLMQEDVGVRDLIRLVEPEVMNQHPTKWQLGQWICHMYNMTIEAKVKQAMELTMMFPDGNPVWKVQHDSLQPLSGG